MVLQEAMKQKNRLDAVQHKTLAGKNFGGFATARKLVEKFLVADNTNNYLSLQHLVDETLVNC